MLRVWAAAWIAVLFLGGSLTVLAQQQPMPPGNVIVPPLVNFSGVLTDANGKSLTGVLGVTFYLYKEEQGGAPLWMETQNVQPDKTGYYTVMLGSTSSTGLPPDIFAAGEAHWLGVQPQGQPEQPRVLLVAVPYALKAADAQTLGGLPASAFMLAAPPNSELAATSGSSTPTTGESASPASSSDVTTNGGAANTIPIFTTATNIQNSILTQTGTTAINVGGKLNLPATGSATSAKGFNSQPLDFVASVFNSSTRTAVPEVFQWQAEPLNNDRSTATGTLNLLYATGINPPTETGLKVTNKGVITFATGQTFPGTVTGVAAGADLTGGGSNGSVTLNVDTTKVPLLNTTNKFTGNQSITGNLSDTGNISASGSVTGQTASFSGNNATQIVSVAQFGGGLGILASSGSGAAVEGVNNSLIPAVGVEGIATGTAGVGVGGVAKSVTGKTFGVYGQANSTSGTGVYGVTEAVTGATFGVNGVSSSANGVGVMGQAPGQVLSGTGQTYAGQWPYGVWGDTSAPAKSSSYPIGVLGTADDNIAVTAHNNGVDMPSIWAENDTEALGGELFYGTMPNDFGNFAVIGDPGCGLVGYTGLQLGSVGLDYGCFNYTLLVDNNGDTLINTSCIPDFGCIGKIYLVQNSAAVMTVTGTDISINGNLSVSGNKNFKIDHPLDPANKYLYHAAIESSEVLNLYTGNAILDARGESVVQLPDWFEAVNKDFRYQLTAIGAPGHDLYIAEEVSGGHFKIAGGKPGGKVSWQVTGTRNDAWEKAHPMVVEADKGAERGHYLTPELYGAPETARIGYFAAPPGGTQMKHHREGMPRRRNTAQLPERTPPSIPIPPKVPPSLMPVHHPVAQASIPELNQK